MSLDQEAPATPSQRTTPVRGVLEVLAVGIVLGVAMGVAWLALAPDLRFTAVKGGGVIPTGSTSDDWFSADGWFAVLGVVVGALLAGVAWWRQRHHPLTALVGVVLGGLAAAFVAWWLGGLLGPPDPGPLTDYDPGEQVIAALGLRATGVLLFPSIVGVFLVLLFTIFTRPTDLEDDPDQLGEFNDSPVTELGDDGTEPGQPRSE